MGVRARTFKPVVVVICRAVTKAADVFSLPRGCAILRREPWTATCAYRIPDSRTLPMTTTNNLPICHTDTYMHILYD